MSDSFREVAREVERLEWADSESSLAILENFRCPNHYKLPIQYFCLDCLIPCVCSECALSRHSNCNVKTLPEAFSTVLHEYVRKWAAKLSARKQNLETTFLDLLEDRKVEWSEKLQIAKLQVSKSNSQMTQTIMESKDKITNLFTNKITDFISQCKKDEDLTLNLTKHLRDNASMLRDRTSGKYNDIELLTFFNQNAEMLRRILSGRDAQSSYLRLVQTPSQRESELKRITAQLDNIQSTLEDVSEFVKNATTCVN
ncbi:tripartite motif protein, putative [Babesia microti strain RI]|uniref:Tripartite motif protein, putative n=1 Tax=Babesia microti (strain RI) TaxID=1133968 RepID=I7IP15_BABMR|nr:tripartite motif protein, putative [Babesia microti strain RI]CCF72595.1 tripartite motif protein, putative [Babesia microti strain RI]|eukprot:XP_012647204.1 tripartite motif protein, putative [Babesia microti strain RI]